ncbi:SDR family oxidoreductase, partial [bacterium]
MADTTTIYGVTGASGKLGREVLALLLDEHRLPPSRLVAITRDPSKLAEFSARGVAVRAGDFDRPETLAAAFAGVGRLLVVSTDAVDKPQRRLAQHRNAVTAAKDAGVQHIVYTSMVAPEEGSPVPFAADHFGTEEALAASGLGFSALRMMWYMEGLIGKAAPALGTGKWVTASGSGKTADIAHIDCSRACVAALTSDFDGQRTLDMTGPTAHTVEEVAALVSQVTRKPIEVVQITPEQLETNLMAAGLPPFVVPIVWGIDVNTRQGRAANVSRDFETLTGRRAISLEEWLTANKAA